MSSRPYSVGQWLPSDKKVLDEWLANVIKEVKVKSKDKLELIFALHPPAEDEETAMGELQSTATLSATDKDLHLHAPVEDLKNAILSDPEINMFFHQMFWQQYTLPEGTKIPSWQLMIIIIDYIMTTAPQVQQNWFGWLPHQCDLELADGYDCWICCFPERQSQQVVQEYSQLLGIVPVQSRFLLCFE
ncbi:hypothetical protein OS493_038667 [Desmophyllum pertusum]|uniref:L-tryptophan decarboxylase PsiD-like domain-containing protein n=1 Tax=Desmophyllum pertusum TaxID=174260 RepID=A0A9W9ZWL8_9CNID|nr:hypothetical protein OS493_038667 [Desmophyllum pertusum]